MFTTVFKGLFLAGLVAMEAIRFPHRKRNQRERRQNLTTGHMSALDVTLDMLAFAGSEVIPLVYIFSPWLDSAGYTLPIWAGWLGLPLFALGLWLLWRAHADLGRNWSPTIEITQEHRLVTEGVYSHIRHPIYAAVWLSVIAQALLLQNWVAGLAGLVTFLPVYLVRVPREERMMLEHFGREYRAYLERTGALLPRLGR
jgi:protein-S-isoprenylcysteine O-methyltransferase Ste14